jgi:hypothetical protein
MEFCEGRSELPCQSLEMMMEYAPHQENGGDAPPVF